jgi:hypothetical protein
MDDAPISVESLLDPDRFRLRMSFGPTSCAS